MGPLVYTYMGRAPQKRVGHQTFRRGEPTPVYDTRAKRIIGSLPYMVPAKAEPKVKDDWRTWHWEQKVKRAKELEPELAEVITTADDAHEILERHLG